MKKALFLHAMVAVGASRRSMSFGPRLPHATFVTEPQQLSHSTNPFLLAAVYTEEVLGYPRDTFYVRTDSYRDSNSGIRHVFLRQVAGGIDVADGNININIVDGKVVSYGDSFFRGPLPNVTMTRNSQPPATYDQAHYCSLISKPSHETHPQLPFQLPTATESPAIALFRENNCRLLSDTVYRSDNLADPKEATLLFIASSHPTAISSENILDNIETLRDLIVIHSDSDTNHITLSNVPETISPIRASLAYIQGPESTLQITWKLEVEMQVNWYEAYIDAYNPSRILSVVDWVSDSGVSDEPNAPQAPTPTYNVWPWGVNDPSEGDRQTVLASPVEHASPLGWHSTPCSEDHADEYLRTGEGLCNFTTTWGNNVHAQENWNGSATWVSHYRPDGHKNMTFDFPYTPEEGPRSYIDLAITQVFYTANMFHDLFYRYGFDEASGNFQNFNFGRGGKQGDAVVAQVQDGQAMNNAMFGAPPDGFHGKLSVAVFDRTTPFRDGVLDGGVVIHELSHGLSARLTGGPADASCLAWGESRGMAEGWGDFFASVIRSTSNYSDFPLAAWAFGRESGIRKYMYSLDTMVNPTTYKSLNGIYQGDLHFIGEVWAEMLWVVMYRLVDKHGFSETLFPPIPDEDGDIGFPNDFYQDVLGPSGQAIPRHGNTLMLQLVVNGMKLQPCRPSFFEAQDAIIHADELLTGGENECELWEGFASRGLGPLATLEGPTPWGGGTREEDFDVPTKCNRASTQ